MPRTTKKRKNTSKGGKNTTCKRRRVRISANGSYNKSDMKHNKKCERKHNQKKQENVREAMTMKMIDTKKRNASKKPKKTRKSGRK